MTCSWWFSPVSSTNKTDRHDITGILLKVVLNTIKQTYTCTVHVHVPCIFIKYNHTDNTKWLVCLFVCLMVFNATFNNISVISWRSVFLVGKPEYPEKTTGELYHIMLYRVHLTWARFELTTLMVKDTNSIGSCKSNYHTITAMTAPSIRCM